MIDSFIAYPHLERFILVDTGGGTICTSDWEGINDHVAELMRTSIDQARTSMEESRELPEYQHTTRKNALNRIMDQWATRNRKITLQGAKDSDGSVITEPSSAAEVFIRHWKDVAQSKRIDTTQAKAFLAKYMRKLPVLKW